MQQGMDLIITTATQVGDPECNGPAGLQLKGGIKETPLDLCDGHYSIDLQKAELYKRNMDVKVSTILSQVEVELEDEAFKYPNRFLTEEEARTKQVPGRREGVPIVVASPCHENPGAQDH